MIGEMLFRRIVVLGAVVLVVGSAACASILGDFEVETGAASSGSVNAEAGSEGNGGGDASSDGNSGSVDAGCQPEQLFCEGRCVGASSAHCGSCSACPASSAICNIPPGDASPFCGSSCSSSAPKLCNETCVDTTSNPNHCGDCGKSCPDVANAKPTCLGDAGCSFECRIGFHVCGDGCAANNDVNSCGTSSCTPCPAPKNGKATCDGRCGVECDQNFHKCNGMTGDICVDSTSPATCGTSCTPCPAPANAAPTCEREQCGFVCNRQTPELTACPGGLVAAAGCFDLKSDPNHCGDCAIKCKALQTCKDGMCQGGVVVPG